MAASVSSSGSNNIKEVLFPSSQVSQAGKTLLPAEKKRFSFYNPTLLLLLLLFLGGFGELGFSTNNQTINFFIKKIFKDGFGDGDCICVSLWKCFY